MAHHTVLPPRPANIRVLFQVGSLKHDHKSCTRKLYHSCPWIPTRSVLWSQSPDQDLLSNDPAGGQQQRCVQGAWVPRELHQLLYPCVEHVHPAHGVLRPEPELAGALPLGDHHMEGLSLPEPGWQLLCRETYLRTVSSGDNTERTTLLLAKVSSSIRSESSPTPMVSMRVSLLGLIITAKFSEARSSQYPGSSPGGQPQT